ncbi:MAG: hypothetical protein WDW38_002071 [Sanguina aurantia]
MQSCTELAARHPFLDQTASDDPQYLSLLSMHQRIVALEAQQKAHKAQIQRLTRTMDYESYREYDAAADTFSDGCCIDWFVWEPLDTMHVMGGSMSARPMSEAHWNAKAKLPVKDSGAKTVRLLLPVERYSYGGRFITIPVQLTVRQLFTAIHAFYDTPVKAEELRGHDIGRYGSGAGYLEGALEGLAAGRRVTWLDLIGSRDASFGGEYSTETAKRRFPLSCSGCVRYEGIRKQDNFISLSLGS